MSFKKDLKLNIRKCFISVRTCSTHKEALLMCARPRDISGGMYSKRNSTPSKTDLAKLTGLTPFIFVGPASCSDRQFLCRRENKCIPARWRCDYVSDCDDGADEQNCTREYKHVFSGSIMYNL